MDTHCLIMSVLFCDHSKAKKQMQSGLNHAQVFVKVKEKKKSSYQERCTAYIFLS